MSKEELLPSATLSAPLVAASLLLSCMHWNEQGESAALLLSALEEEWE